MDLELFYQSCRICSTELENGVLVFGEEGKTLYLQTKIRKYLYITVTVDDKLPKMICRNCCTKLENIHGFATKAVKIQEKFHKLVAEFPNSFNNHETNENENRGLLHKYLTKGIKETLEDVTELEVKVDPMLVLQYGMDDEKSADAACDTETQFDDGNSNGALEGYYNSHKYPNHPSRNLYSCNLCTRYFASEFALHSHMWSHPTEKKNVVFLSFNNSLSNCDWQPKMTYAGYEQYCTGRTSSTSSEPETGDGGNAEYNHNENDSNTRLECPICGKSISTKGNLKVHLETHRPKGKYGCDICGRIFKTQCNLFRHKEYHAGVQFPCGVCGRVYPTNSTLRAHSITHSDLRPHRCPLCSKTFKRNQDLKVGSLYV